MSDCVLVKSGATINHPGSDGRKLYDDFIHNRHLLVRHEPTAECLGRASYSKTAFNNSFRLYLLDTCTSLPGTNLHECILGANPHKMHFDVDIENKANLLTLDDAERICNTLIAKSIRVWNINYSGDVMHEASRDCDFIVYSSHDYATNSKFSFHIVCFPLFAFKSWRQCAEFYALTLAEMDESVRRYIDPIHKSNHNLRILGVSKGKRIKILDPRLNCAALIATHKWSDSLITDTRNCAKTVLGLNRAHIEDIQSITISVDNYADSDDIDCELSITSKPLKPSKFVAAILAEAKSMHLLAGFRHVSTSMNAAGIMYLGFHRTSPSFCTMCDRQHETDNSLYIVVVPPNSYSLQHRVYAKCRRNNANAKICIGAVDTDETLSSIIDRDESPSISKTVSSSAKLIPIDNVSAQVSNKFAAHPLNCIYTEDTMRAYERHRTICVDAPMKLGKTKALINFIGSNFDGDSVIRILTFRQTFAFSMYTSCKDIDFVLYSDCKGLLKQKRVIVQLESMHRLPIEPVDLLVLDESESLFEQMDSGLFKNFSQAFATLKYMMEFAKTIICMDAYMSDRTYNLIERFRGIEDMIYYRNLFSRDRDIEMMLTTNKGELIFDMLRNIKIGKKVAIMTNSKSDADAIELLVKNISSIHLDVMGDLPSHAPQLDDKATLSDLIHTKIDGKPREWIPAIDPPVETPLIGKYTSEEPTVDIKAKHFQNIDHYWSQYDVLITTPTVSAGVSFERSHYDVVYGYFTNQSCGAEMSMQMLGRIRCVKDKRYLVCISESGSSGYPTSRNEIRHAVLNRYNLIVADIDTSNLSYTYTESGALEIASSDYFALWVENQRIRHINRNNYMLNMIKLCKKSGFNVVYSPLMIGESKNTTELQNAYAHLNFNLDEIKDYLKNLKFANIAKAVDLTQTEYSDILRRIDEERDYSLATAKQSQVTKQEVHAVDKYSMATFYDVAPELRPNITDEQVAVYYPKLSRTCYKMLKQFIPVRSKEMAVNELLTTMKESQHTDFYTDAMYHSMMNKSDSILRSMCDKKILFMSTDIDIHYNIHAIITKLGWRDIFDIENLISVKSMCRAIIGNEQYFKRSIDNLNILLDKRYKFSFSTSKLVVYDDGQCYDESITGFIRTINTLLKSVYSIKLISAGRHTFEHKLYCLKDSDLFTYRDGQFMTSMSSVETRTVNSASCKPSI